MTFHVGQKVVCVNSSGWVWLTKGVVYTVDHVHHDGCIGVGQNRNVDEIAAYSPERFRPIIERKTDISIFTKMLTKTGVDA